MYLRMMQTIKKYIITISVGLGLVLSVSAPVALLSSSNALAACSSGADCLQQGKTGEIMKLLKLGLNILSGAVGVLAVIMVIVGGIQYSASNGDSSKVTAAKKKISNVLIGLLAYVFLYAFLQWLIPGGIWEAP
jgi:hypothetical protein